MNADTRTGLDPTLSADVEGLLVAVGGAPRPQVEREAASAELKRIARDAPGGLLPYWPQLLGLLESDNAFTRMAMVHVFAELAPVADPASWAALVEPFYAHLGDAVSVAGHVLQVTPRIVAGRPELREPVISAVLRLPQRAIPERLGLLRGRAIEALDAVTTPAQRDEAVIGFVVEGLAADSPGTRKIARETLRRWELAG